EHLVFMVKEMLVDTQIYQVDNGTLFYHDYSQTPQRLYVKWMGTEVQVKYPDLFVHGAHGNSMLFESDGKIYSAYFSEADGLIILFLRHRNEHEIHFGTLCSRVRAGVKYVYHLDEDPYTGGIPVDVPLDLQAGLELKGTHRNKIIYVGQSVDGNSRLNEITTDAIVLELPTDPSEAQLFARVSSTILYVVNSNDGLLFTVNTETGEFLPTLKFRKFCNVVGFHDGEMTVTSTENGECHVMTARLPNDKLSSLKQLKTSQRQERKSMISTLRGISRRSRELSRITRREQK
ncbi:hypothetical protein PENTCL1PPCAC_8385, partial [Pristionchus entomophagus]